MTAVSPATSSKVRNFKWNPVTLRFSDPEMEASYLRRSAITRKKSAIQIHSLLWPFLFIVCICDRVLVGGSLPLSVPISVGAFGVIFGWVLSALLSRDALWVDGTAFICCHYWCFLLHAVVFIPLSLESWEATTLNVVLGGFGMTTVSLVCTRVLSYPRSIAM